MTDRYLQKDVLNSKFNVESKYEVKMGYFRKCRHFENSLFELGTVDYSRLPIFVLIRFWEIRVSNERAT
jgi:hypothetical protein